MFLTMMASTKLGLWNDAISNTIGLGKLVLLDVVQQRAFWKRKPTSYIVPYFLMFGLTRYSLEEG